MLRPLELMLLCLAGVLTERDRLINLYLREENRILREQVSDTQHLLFPAYFPQYNGAMDAGMHVLRPRLYTIAYDPNNTTRDELEQARALSNLWLCERRRTSALDRWRSGHRPIPTNAARRSTRQSPPNAPATSPASTRLPGTSGN